MSRVLLLASLMALGGCYPDFQFGSDGGPSSGRSSASAGGSGTTITDTSSTGGAQTTSTTSGEGGAQTTAGSGGDTTTTSTSSGPPPVTTPCGPSQNQMLHACEPGQACCYDQNASEDDRCDASGACDSDDYVLACDEQSDCAPGGICCAAYYEIVVPFFDGAVGCYTSCPSPNRKVCKTSADCGGGTCGAIGALDSNYAQYYKVCQ